MFLTIAIVFTAVFALAVAALTASGFFSAAEKKQVRDRLEAVTLAGRRNPEDESLSLLREELLGSTPALDRWMRRLDWFPKLRRLLMQAGMKWTVSETVLKMAGVAAVAAALVYWRTEAVPFALLLGAFAGGLPLAYVLYRRSKRFGAFEAQLPETLELMVRALRAGHGLMAAVEMVAREVPDPIGGEFRKCFEEQNFGLDFRETMLNLTERVSIHDVQLLVTALLIQKESGGNLAEILEKVAYVIRDRFRLRRQIRVHTAQGRLTGVILALMPVVCGVGLYLVNPEHMSKLWTHPTGLKLMYASVVMTTVGALVIRKIIRVQI
jgi:tight adherence protein B